MEQLTPSHLVTRYMLEQESFVCIEDKAEDSSFLSYFVDGLIKV